MSFGSAKLFVALLVITALQLPALAYASELSAPTLKPLYTFESLAVLMFGNLSPMYVRLYLDEEMPGINFVTSSSDILGYVAGTAVYSRVEKALRGVDMVEVSHFCGLIAGVDDVRVERNGSTLRILVPAGPCTIDRVPVLLWVSGTVYLDESSPSRVVIRVNANASPPLSQRYNRIDVPEGYEWVAKLFRGELSGLKLYAEFTIVDGHVYQDGVYIGFGFTPFYIAYPRNASEVKEVVEKNVNVNYMGFPVKFSMIKHMKRYERFGGLVEVRNVSIIIASMTAPQIVGFASEAMDRASAFYSEYEYFESSVLAFFGEDFTNVKDFIVYTMLGEKPALSYTKARAKTDAVYVVYQRVWPSAEVWYISAYPVRFYYVPLRAVAEISDGEEKRLIEVHLILLGSHAEFRRSTISDYSPGIRYLGDLDPYSIDIGFYSPEAGECGACWLRFAVPALVAVVAVVGVVVYVRWRGK